MGKIVAEHWVKADLMRVFGFFSKPENLPKLMPDILGVRLGKVDLRSPGPDVANKVVESGLNPAKVAGPGSRIEISFRYLPFLPLRGRWIAEIVEYEPLLYFVDEQRSGPLQSWRHRHSFRAETRDGVLGTVIRDEVEYDLPFGGLGRVADSLFAQRAMQRMFRSRQQHLEQLLFA